MIEVTIFTPTYNRIKELINLYKSLKEQTNVNFKWIVVDDGSTDGTKEIMLKLKEQSQFDITYYYQNNSGKHIAHNKAVELCDTQYFICVDSDDVLEKNAVDIIYKSLYDLNKSLIGIIFPRKNRDNVLDNWDCVEKYINIIDLKFLYKIKGETSILIKTEYLKLNLFPNIENEKFMSEEILYQKLVEYGKFEFVNLPICIYEYQENGLTKNLYKNWSKNFKSTLLLLKNRYDILKNYKFNIKIINRIKTIMNINALCINNNKNIWKETPSKLYSIILLLPSIVWKEKKYGRNKKSC